MVTIGAGAIMVGNSETNRGSSVWSHSVQGERWSRFISTDGEVEVAEEGAAGVWHRQSWRCDEEEDGWKMTG